MNGMCGFLGIFAPPQAPLTPAEISAFGTSSKLLAHRGNSSHGEDRQSERALFHYRLAFRDLQEGTQPLSDSKSRATILFNGELYGFRSLREKLSRNYEFRTRSDTEVILAAYLEYGEKFLETFDGEYAFVIHDHRQKKILAARDAFGVKPLFWSASGGKPSSSLQNYSAKYHFSLPGRVHFASEIKGLGLPLRWDARGLDRLFLSLYEEMGTSFEGVYALAPGALFSASANGDTWQCSLERKIRKQRSPDKNKVSFPEKAQELQQILARTVQAKLEADVPLGAYLSGGIDSRIAAYEMGKTGAQIETFTVGFEGRDFDETGEVKKFLSAYPNLRGRALTTSNQILEYAYPHAIYSSELVQPYTNGAAKWWLSRFARRYVRGVLTGDGADEIFCGYPSYRYLAWWDFYRRNPSPARASLFEKKVVGKKEKFWEKGLSSRPDGSDLEESLEVLGWAHPLFAQVKSLGKFWSPHGWEKILEKEKSSLQSYLIPGASSLNQWQNYFLHTHFPTHVLNWVGDRMEMANTLEGRPIFLSREVWNFVESLPDGYLVRGLKDKAILRKAYAQKLGAFAGTPKKQFNAPFLLDGALANEFLSPASLKETGLLDPARLDFAKNTLRDSKDPLEKSFAQIFLQNCLVTQMLDRYLVRGQAPIRNLDFEENYLDKNTVNL